MTWSLSIVAQTTGVDDTVRTIVLQEVMVSSKGKSQQQDLFNYYKANRAATTEDILSKLPELSLVRRGSYGMEPVIRGFNSSQVNLLLDGMRIHGACTDRMDPASIYLEPANLNSIEVQTGGRSSLNGSSIGGNINMKLEEAACHSEPLFSGNVSSGFHTASSSFFQSVSLKHSASRLGLRASGTYRKSNNYRDGSGKSVRFSQYEKVNYSINAKYRLGEETFIKADLIADDGWNIGYPALPMDVGYANARIGSLSIIRNDLAARWERLEAKLYANRVKHFMDDTRRPDVPVHMDMPGESFTTGFFAEGTRRINSSRLTLRADASSTFLKASMTMYQDEQVPMYMLTWPDNRQLQAGFAAQYSFSLNPVTSLRLNARTEISSFRLTSQAGKDQLAVFNFPGEDNNYFIPSVSAQLSRQVAKQLRASLSVGMNGRGPTASELYGFYLFSQFDGYDYIGNPSLERESGLQAELSVMLNIKKLKIQASGYLTRVANYITAETAPGFSAMTIGAKGVKQYFNAEHAILSGMEASVVYMPYRNIQVVSVLKYSRGQNDGGEPLSMISPFRNTSSIKFSAGKIWLQAEAEFSASQNRVDVSAGEKPTGSFSLFHFRSGFATEFRKTAVQLNAGVENIFDVFYREHLDWGNIPRPGRNIYIQAGISF